MTHESEKFYPSTKDVHFYTFKGGYDSWLSVRETENVHIFFASQPHCKGFTTNVPFLKLC